MARLARDVAALVAVLCAASNACIDQGSVYYSGVVFNDGETVDMARLKAMGTEGVHYFTECSALDGTGLAVNLSETLAVDTQAHTVNSRRFDPVTVNAASVEKNTLVLSVTYGGGCGTHDFVLYADGSLLESNPPHLVLWLSHNAYGDSCKALITQQVRFNLRPLADFRPPIQDQDSIVLDIFPDTDAAHTAAGWKPTLVCGVKYRGHHGNSVMIEIGEFPLPVQPDHIFPRLVAIFDSTHVPTAAEKATAIDEELQWLREDSIFMLSDEEIRMIVDTLTAYDGQYWTLQNSARPYNMWFAYDDSTGSWNGMGFWEGGCGANVSYELPPQPLSASGAAFRVCQVYRVSGSNRPRGEEIFDLRGARTGSARAASGIAIVRSGDRHVLRRVVRIGSGLVK